MGLSMSCANCAYENNDFSEEPCNTCNCINNWTSADRVVPFEYIVNNRCKARHTNWMEGHYYSLREILEILSKHNETDIKHHLTTDWLLSDDSHLEEVEA